MDDKKLLGQLLIFGAVNVVVLWLLEKYDRKIAMLYAILLAFLAVYTYRNEFFSSVNVIIGTVKGLTDNV